MFDVPDPPLIAHAAEVPDEHALQGFEAVRAFTRDPDASRTLLEEGLAFEHHDAGWEARGEERGGRMIYDRSDAPGESGAGTVHHVAWSVGMDEQDAWRERVIKAGAHPTPVIDRFWFRSVYFREPSGVLFELATRGPGFTADEPLETLGRGAHAAARLRAHARAARADPDAAPRPLAVAPREDLGRYVTRAFPHGRIRSLRR